jgi:hypothetical protein
MLSYQKHFFFFNLKERHQKEHKTAFSILTAIEMNLLYDFKANGGLCTFNLKKQ